MASQRGLEDERMGYMVEKVENIPDGDASPGRVGWGGVPAVSCTLELGGGWARKAAPGIFRVSKSPG